MARVEELIATKPTDHLPLSHTSVARYIASIERRAQTPLSCNQTNFSCNRRHLPSYTESKSKLRNFTLEEYTTALGSSLPDSQDLVFSVSRLKTTMNYGAATLLVNHREANLLAAFITLKNNFLGGLASFVLGSMR